MVARVLERLGGTWWAEGEVGGAMFYFALPEGGTGRRGWPSQAPPEQ